MYLQLYCEELYTSTINNMITTTNIIGIVTQKLLGSVGRSKYLIVLCH